MVSFRFHISKFDALTNEVAFELAVLQVLHVNFVVVDILIFNAHGIIKRSTREQADRVLNISNEKRNVGKFYLQQKLKF